MRTATMTAIALVSANAVEGDKVSHHVDVSWNESWTGNTIG
jgi:hypothetical protein